MAQHGKVLGPVPGAQPTLIFPKGHSERPMEVVLTPPVLAHGPGKWRCLRREAGMTKILSSSEQELIRFLFRFAQRGKERAARGLHGFPQLFATPRAHGFRRDGG